MINGKLKKTERKFTNLNGIDGILINHESTIKVNEALPL